MRIGIISVIVSYKVTIKFIFFTNKLLIILINEANIIISINKKFKTT